MIGNIRPPLTQTFHKDADGNCKPDEFVGNTYFHPKTQHLYKVTGYGIDSEREVWLLQYERLDEDGDTCSFKFFHTIANFTREGRFRQVKH